MSDAQKKKRLDASSARRIAVAADVDDRTVFRVLKTGVGRPHRSRERARDALVAAGYEVPGGDDE